MSDDFTNPKDLPNPIPRGESLEESIETYLNEVLKLTKGVPLDKEQQIAADATATLAVNIQALVAMHGAKKKRPVKPLTIGSRVRILKGPYMDQTGFFQGNMESLMGGYKAKIELEDIDQDIEVDQDDLEVI